jgi:hypothetical protein
MLTKADIKLLKQSNVASDKEKVKQRVREIWFGAGKDRREEVLDLVDVMHSSVQRIYKRGTISAKMVMAFAQVFNLNPNYLTGSSDKKEAYSQAAAVQFLTDKNYKKLIKNIKPDSDKPEKAPKTERTPKAVKAAPATETATADGSDVLAEIKATIDAKTDFSKTDAMPSETAEFLLKGLCARAEYNGGAKAVASIVKYLLTL